MAGTQKKKKKKQVVKTRRKDADKMPKVFEEITKNDQNLYIQNQKIKPFIFSYFKQKNYVKQ